MTGTAACDRSGEPRGDAADRTPRQRDGRALAPQPTGRERGAVPGSVTGNSARVLGAQVAGNAGYFVSVLLLARGLAPADRGAVAFVTVTGLVIATLASLGTTEATKVFAAQRPAVRARPALQRAAGQRRRGAGRRRARGGAARRAAGRPSARHRGARARRHRRRRRGRRAGAGRSVLPAGLRPLPRVRDRARGRAVAVRRARRRHLDRPRPRRRSRGDGLGGRPGRPGAGHVRARRALRRRRAPGPAAAGRGAAVRRAGLARRSGAPAQRSRRPDSDRADRLAGGARHLRRRRERLGGALLPAVGRRDRAAPGGRHGGGRGRGRPHAARVPDRDDHHDRRRRRGGAGRAGAAADRLRRGLRGRRAAVPVAAPERVRLRGQRGLLHRAAGVRRTGAAPRSDR